MKFLNLAGVSTVYTESPNGFDISSAATRIGGLRTFAEMISNGLLHDGDVLTLSVEKDVNNAMVARVYYEQVTEFLHITSTSDELGVISDEDPVIIVATVTPQALIRLNVVTMIGTATLVDNAFAEQNFISDEDHINSTVLVAYETDPTVITLPYNDYQPTFEVIRASTGAVTFTPDTGATINGGTSDVSIPAQWGKAKVWWIGPNFNDWCVIVS